MTAGIRAAADLKRRFTLSGEKQGPKKTQTVLTYIITKLIYGTAGCHYANKVWCRVLVCLRRKM